MDIEKQQMRKLATEQDALQQKLVPVLSELIKKYIDYKEKQKQNSWKNSGLKEKKMHYKIHRFLLLKKMKDVTTKIKKEKSSTDKKPNGSLSNKNSFRKTMLTKRYISLRNKISEYQGITSDMTVQAEIKKCTKEKQKTLAAAVKTRESFQKKKHYLNALKSRADYQLTDAVEMLKLKMQQLAMIKEKEASKADRLEMLKMRNYNLTKEVKEKNGANDKIKKDLEIREIRLTLKGASLAPASRLEPDHFYSQPPKENDGSQIAKTQ